MYECVSAYLRTCTYVRGYVYNVYVDIGIYINIYVLNAYLVWKLFNVLILSMQISAIQFNGGERERERDRQRERENKNKFK